MSSALELQRTALFEVPSWSAYLNDVVPFHGEMLAEIDADIDSSRRLDRNVLGHQTVEDPCRLPSPGWKRLDQLTQAVFAQLVREHFSRWRNGELHLRRWALRLGRLNDEEKQRLERDGMHNHLPALFSSIYYLSVPNGIPEGERGTEFVNPLANVMDLFSPRTSMVDGVEGQLVIFPSFLDHRPVPRQWNADADPARVIVSTDVYFVTGQADVSSAEPIGASTGT